MSSSSGDGWVELPLSEAVQINPSVAMKRAGGSVPVRRYGIG